MSNKALVISGGGARGAWGVGVAKALIKDLGNSYNTVIGTSTGTLMGPFILGDRFEELEEAYTSVTQKDIFNVNPFKSDGGIKTFNAIWRVIGGKKTLGESKPLKELINKFVDISLYNELRNSNKTFGATVVNLTTAESEVKTLKDNSFNDLKDWIWASANNPVFMSLLEKDGQFWTDGGLKDYASIDYVLKNDLADEIDVLLHSSSEITNRNFTNIGNVIDLILRTIDVFFSDVIQNDIQHAKLEAELDKEIMINFYYMSKDQVNRFKNSLIFDKSKMQSLLNEGFQSVLDGTIIKNPCKICTNGQIEPLIA